MDGQVFSGVRFAWGQTGRVWAIGFSLWLVMFLTALALTLVSPAAEGMERLLPITASLGVLVTVWVVSLHVLVYRDFLGPLRQVEIAGAVLFMIGLWAAIVVVLALSGQLDPLARLIVGDTIYRDFSDTLRVSAAFYLLPLAVTLAFLPLVAIYRGLILRDYLGEVDWGAAVGGAIIAGLAILVALVVMSLTPYIILPLVALLQAAGAGFSPSTQTAVVIMDQIVKVLVFSLGMGVATGCLRMAVAGSWSADSDHQPQPLVDESRPVRVAQPRTAQGDPVIDWDAVAADDALAAQPRHAPGRTFWRE